LRARLVDVAMFDCMAISLTTYPSIWSSFAGWPSMEGTGRTLEVPSIVPTKDGFAVFTTNSAQQLQDFLVMIGRPEWLEDEDWARVWKRYARRREFLAAVHEYSNARTTVEVEADAGLYRIPAAPVLNGSSVTEFEHFRVRNVFSPCAHGPFREPRVPYRIVQAAAPVDDHGRGARVPDSRALTKEDSNLPLSGIRVLDCTAWWAGPSATHALACLGADVVKVESHRRPDAMRTASVRSARHEDWLEWSPIFHATNSSKRGVTIDLSDPVGVERFRRLASEADLVVENNTPRVMEQFGLGWPELNKLNPSLIMVRMPAFGLDGPWRDRTGFAQTMESISGMSWVTGFPDEYPVLVRGACDPVAGMHAVVATMLALRARQTDGNGRLVEVPMVGSALNITAEQVIEWDVNQVILGRNGSRGAQPTEGVYRCDGDDRWVAISATTDAQWVALSSIIDAPGDLCSADQSLRLARWDEIDSLIEHWTSARQVDDVVRSLIDAGIPAADVVRGRDIVRNPQLRHRGLFEVEEHPVTGAHELPTLPFRFSDVSAWMRSPAPTIGQHNGTIWGVAVPSDDPTV
jgi:crotonobetainyl-CoA:carnitine CoA-transferase CaiB-like acyl-CoA transferase